jgi:hypothetical protein
VLPLYALLSRVLGHVTTEAEASARVGPDVPSLAVWSNVLRCVAEAGADGLDERELPERARISSRLATAAVTGAARRGWVIAEPVAGGGKHRRARLADAGLDAANLWPEHLAQLDSSQLNQSPLRALLEQLVGKLEFELPHFPASYGAADPSAIGSPFMQNTRKKDDSRLVHGKDWKPVLRGEGDTVSSLPVTALLSQALMAFTIDYESGFPWPLESTANVLRHISVEPRSLAEVPGDHGITGAGKSLLERHLIVAVSRDDSGPRAKLVALTDRGVAVLQHHPGRLEAVEGQWREHFGDDVIAGIREALEPLAAGAASDQPDHLMAPLHTG